jgi:hypothetical protein
MAFTIVTGNSSTIELSPSYRSFNFEILLDYSDEHGTYDEILVVAPFRVYGQLEETFDPREIRCEFEDKTVCARCIAHVRQMMLDEGRREIEHHPVTNSEESHNAKT